jgi:hypothetical protein
MRRGIKAGVHKTPYRLRAATRAGDGQTIGRAASVSFDTGAGEGRPGVGKRECSAHDILKLAAGMRAAAT